TAGAVGCSAQSEDNDADVAPDGTEDSVVGVHHAVRVVEQILGVLQSGLAETGIDIYGHPPARTRPHELRCARVAGPCGGCDALPIDVDWVLSLRRCLDGVFRTH